MTLPALKSSTMVSTVFKRAAQHRLLAVLVKLGSDRGNSARVGAADVVGTGLRKPEKAMKQISHAGLVLAGWLPLERDEVD